MVDKQILYEFLTLVPQRKVVTYNTLADIFLTSPVVIGKLIAQNKQLDKYPCYKVVGSDGSLR